MDKEIKKLVKLTTIIRVDNNTTRKVEFGDEYSVSYDKNHLINYTKLQQINLSDLEQYWNKKWASFNGKWNLKRQYCRNFYDTFQLFYYSFYQLKQNKVASIQGDNKHDEFLHNSLAGTNLYGVYSHGKKCIDLIKKIKMKKVLNYGDKKFIKKFTETRNKFFEHNFNPTGLKLKIEPVIWSLASTNSFMDVIIHGAREREYDVRFDYYEDYFKLEDLLVKIIKKF